MMTKQELDKLCKQQARRIYDLEMALKLLACHARDASGQLPPMHAADEQHVTRLLQTVE